MSCLGVDVGGTKLLLTIGESLSRVPTGPDTSPQAIEAEIRGFLRGSVVPAAVGVAVPGLVDAEGRVTACDVLPRLVGWSPADSFRDLGVPVRVVNDGEAALAEETHDLPPHATAAVVMVGTAVGAGFLVEGRPLRGAGGWAGELGYLPFPTPDGVRRLDELAGGAFLAARLGTDGAGLHARAEAGDPEALAVIREGGAALGLALAGVIHLLNPHHVAVGGGTAALPGYWEAAREAAERHTLPEMWSACTLTRVRTGEAVVALGAARLAAGTTRWP